MATPQQIDEQVKLERLQVSMGIEQLRKNTKQLEDKSYASASVYGHSSIAELLPHLVRHLHKTDARLKERKVGHQLKEINQYIFSVDFESSSLIALKTVFDQVFSSRRNADLVTNVTTMIGQNLEDECQMRYYEKNYPGFLASIKKAYWHDSIGTRQKLQTTQTIRLDDTGSENHFFVQVVG